MSKLLLALLLATSSAALAGDRSDDRPSARQRLSCAADVSFVDARGRLREARRVSASRVASLVIRGRVQAGHDDESDETLLFDVYSPRGRRYQVLLAQPRVVTSERNGRRVEKASQTREATLAVAGFSIALTSMYGTWRVEPRLEGEMQACGRPEYFTIRP
jgi:hypothetical protein